MSRFILFSSVFLPMALLAVLVGNYAEDPGFLSPPDIVTIIPTNGEVKASLMPNPQGLSEMVRITVSAADLVGSWLGATMLSKLMLGTQRQHMPRKSV